MKPTQAIVAIGSIVLLASAQAQHAHPGHGTGVQAQVHAHGHAHGHAHAGGSYAGMQSRTIKALSDQEIADIRAGKGMSLALPAELNGYPGPMHVLELAGPLELSEQQRVHTEALFEQMQREARAAGEELIVAEAALDDLFKRKQATAPLLAQATAGAASAHGKLRETHLRYHVLMTEVLSPEQIAEYNRLRGY